MPQTSVAVLGGTGQQGRGIAQRLALAGFRIIIGSRDPGPAAAAIAQWPPAIKSIPAEDYGSAILAAQIIVLAVPFGAVDRLLEDHHDRFKSDTLVIDVTVPVTFAAGRPTLDPVAEGSAAEHIRARLPAHVRFAATFKTLPAHALGNLQQSLDCDEFVCGDSADARSAASGLVQSIAGLRAVDAGPLSRARGIEHLTLLAIAINRQHKIRDARFRVVGL